MGGKIENKAISASKKVEVEVEAELGNISDERLYMPKCRLEMDISQSVEIYRIHFQLCLPNLKKTLQIFIDYIEIESAVSF